jgi:hypothetical protein
MAAMLVGALGGLLLNRDDRSSAPASCGIARARIARNEWPEGSWGAESAPEERVGVAEEVCLGGGYVDIAGAVLAISDDCSLLDSDAASLVHLADAQGIVVGAVAGDGGGRHRKFTSTPAQCSTSSPTKTTTAQDWRASTSTPSPGLSPSGPTSSRNSRMLSSSSRSTSSNAVPDADPAPPVAYVIPYSLDGCDGDAPMTSFVGDSMCPIDRPLNLPSDRAAVSVMAYSNRALGEGGIVNLLRQELAQRQVPVLVGVETAPIEPAPLEDSHARTSSPPQHHSARRSR